MILFEKTVKTFLATMSCFFFRYYIIDSHLHFIRERKMTYEDVVKFIFWNKGRNNDIELTEYLKVFKGKKYETMSHQAIGRQRMFIKPELFIRIYKKFIDKIYKEHPHFSEIKGYIAVACDGSIFQLPNVTLTRNEFKIGDHTIFEKKRIRARVSGMLDVNSNFMLTTKIVEKTVKETTLAMQHLDDLKKRFDITKFIAIYDRGYKSIELMLYTEKLNSKFLIRIPKNTFKKQRRKIKGKDKIIGIKLTNAIIKEFENEELKKMAKQMGEYNLRIVEITLLNGSTVILATNLDKEEFTIEELKELYAKRWSIETGFKKLKSQVMIQRFSGHRRIIIEQDFYASIFIYNLATAIQWDGEKLMKVKQRNPHDEFIRKSNFASIVGILYVYMEDVLSCDFNIIDEAMSFFIKQAKRLYHQKNLVKLELMRALKISEDLALQMMWGEKWEDHKPVRVAEDPTNRNPGNPKPTH